MADSGFTSKKSSVKTQGKPAGSMAELMARQGSSVQILQKGQVVSGIIKKLTPQEILMDIGAKGDALVIEFDKKNLENLLANLKVGDRVNATVISPESEGGFPVLSLRRTLDDIIFKKYEDLEKSDEAFEVEIAEATRGGYFAITSEGIRGFLPASQVISGEAPSQGDKILVKILEYDRAKKRVVFSQKATLYLTNIDAIKSLVNPGEVLEAEISEVLPYGLFAKIHKGDSLIEGFVHISEVSHDRVEDIGAVYKVGDLIKAQVLEIDEANRRVNLSIKKTLADVFESIREKYKPEDRLHATVIDIKSRGITLQILLPDSESGEAGEKEVIKGFIPSDKIPSGTNYELGQEVEAEIVDFDDRRRVIILSPVLKAVPIGYR